MSLRRGSRRWLSLALLAPGLLLLAPAPAPGQPPPGPQPKNAKKPKPAAQIQPTAQTPPKGYAKAGAQAARPAEATRSSARPEPARAGSRGAMVARAGRSGQSAAEAARPVESCVHVVRSGETLARIAARHRVSRDTLAATNRLTSPAALRSGQRLTVPGCRLPVDGTVETASIGSRGSQAASAEPLFANSEFLVARVGPRRIPTRLHVAIPEFTGDEVEFAWPIDGPVLSGFGRRRGGWHAGVDIRAERGTPIRAAAPGIVIFSGWETYYGKLVKVEHPNGFVTLYAHNHENLVQVGDSVDTETVLATVGRTGRATGDHLHFEIRRNGMAYNPTHLLDVRDMPTLLATPYLPAEPDQVPVSALSPDEIEQP